MFLAFVFLCLCSFGQGLVTLYAYDTANCAGLPLYAYANVDSACDAGTQTSCDTSTEFFTVTQYNDLTCQGNVSSSSVCSTGCHNLAGRGSYGLVCSSSVALMPGSYLKLTFHGDSNACNGSDVTSYAYVSSGQCTSVGPANSFFVSFISSSVVELKTFSDGNCGSNDLVSSIRYNIGCNSQTGISASRFHIALPAPSKWKLILIIVFSIVGGIGLLVLIVYLFHLCFGKKIRPNTTINVGR